jgi:ribose 5-phosphate isomerase B
LGHEVTDYGTNSSESCDYPDFAYKVALDVSENKSQKGVLICGTGIGMVIAANKVPNIRAGICGTRKQPN